MNRILSVARIHTFDCANVLVLPWVVLASALAINLIVWLLLPEGAVHATGGILSLYGFAWAMVSVLIARGFPFQLGLGVTRRDFLTGTYLFLAAFAVGSAMILTGLNLLERATDGFGLGGRFFRVPWITDVPDAQLVAIYALPMVCSVGFAMVFAAVWYRFKSAGVVALVIGLSLAIVAVIAVVTWRDAWPSVGAWLSAAAPLTVMLVVGGVGVLANAGAWVTLRTAPV